MCGRFTLSARLAQLQDRYAIQSVSSDYTPDYQPYNIAPTQQIPIVRMKEKVETKVKELITAKWGFSIGSNIVINSRNDKITTSKVYQQALESTRCLIPANGFFEWKNVEGRKIPYYFKTTDQDICSYAGFYQYAARPNEENKLGCTILTTRPNTLVSELHDRMPVILTPASETLWLDHEASKRELLNCLKPYPVDHMETYELSQKVNNVNNSSPEMINPYKNVFKSKGNLGKFL